jgi:hypothetical protein
MNDGATFLFPCEADNTRPVPKVNNAHDRAVRDSKLARFRLYDLRHTWATRAAMSGIDLVTLAAMLGHSRIQMVLRYAHPLRNTSTKPWGGWRSSWGPVHCVFGANRRNGNSANTVTGGFATTDMSDSYPLHTQSCSCKGAANLLKDWRRGSGSNRRIKVLQTSPLPLGYRASLEAWTLSRRSGRLG